MLNWERKPKSKHISHSPFNAMDAINKHHDLMCLVENYVNKKSKVKPDIEGGCRAVCQFCRCMDGEIGEHLIDSDLLNSICLTCEEFYEHATHAVLMASINCFEPAKASLQRAQGASNKYLSCLAAYRD